MKSFQKEIFIEKANLVFTMKNMIKFMKSKDFNAIEEIDKKLMKDQIFYMGKYLKTLNKRIKNF